MKSIIYKDVQLVKKSIIAIIIYQLVLFIIATIVGNIFGDSTGNSGFDGFIAGTIVGMSVCMGYAMTFAIFNLDDKNKSNIYLNSVPVKKSYTVIGRYLAVFIYVLIVFVTQVLMTEMMHLFRLNLSIRSLFELEYVSLIISIILVCISSPFFFKFSVNKALLISMLSYLTIGTVFGIAAMVSNLNVIAIIKGITIKNFSLISIPGCILLFLASSVLSLRFYPKREF